MDLTGQAADNFISAEYHQITTGAQTVIRPDFGDFYRAGLQLFGVSSENNMTLLRAGEHYDFGHLNEQATASADGEVYQVVLLKDTAFFTTFSLSYHAYGGPTNINYNRMYNQYVKAREGMPTPWANLVNRPVLFNPEPHKNDAKDLYGLEYVKNFIDNLTSAMSSSRVNEARYTQLRVHLRSFESMLQQASAKVQSAAREHIDNTNYAHTYTKAMIGLGQVANYAFTPVVINGDTLPAYASPQVVMFWTLTSPPNPNPPVHVGLTDNPHGTTKAMVDLGDVQNLAFESHYTLGISEYETLLDPNATEVYLGPAAFVGAVDEYIDDVYATVTQPIIDGVIADANAKLDQADTILTATAAVQASAEALIAPLQQNTIDIDRKASQAVSLNRRFVLLQGNATYSETLIQLMNYEQTNFDVGKNVYPDGYLPVPTLIDSLELWLSAANAQNVLTIDLNGNMRVTKLVDRSRHARIFEAPANTAPILADSQDLADDVPGMTVAKVMHFTPGLCLNQSSGKVFSIKPGMTVIALSRASEVGTQLALLTNPNAAEDAGIYSFTPDSQSLAVRSGTPWRPLEAPPNSADPNTSAIVAGVVAADAEPYCWLASTKAISYIPYPRGVNTPASSWPTSSFVSSAFTQMGNANYGSNNRGEVAELLVFNRALTKPEVRAVVEYLRLRYSDATALAVDYAAINAF